MYPEPKQRELSEREKAQIRERNERPRSKLRGIKTLKTQNLRTNNSKRSKRRGIRPPEIQQGDDNIYKLAQECACSSSQIAGIKAALHR